MRLNVELAREVYEEMARYAQRDGRSLSDVVRQLVAAWCREKRIEERAERAGEEAER